MSRIRVFAVVGRRLEVEVRDLQRDTAKAAIQAALDEVAATERLLRTDSTEAAGSAPSSSTAHLAGALNVYGLPRDA